MKRLLFLLGFLAFISAAQSQMGYLFVKKGYKKKRTYLAGDRIYLQLKNDSIYTGLITQLKNDTILLNGNPVPVGKVQAVIVREKKKKMHVSGNELLLITGGVALVATGITASSQRTFGEALTSAMAIGYGPLVFKYIGSKISLRRKKFKIGRKFHLQVLDFHMPRRRGF